MARKEEGRWIQLGAVEGEDGRKHGGSPVFVQGGKIVKGAPSLTGRKIDAMKEPPEESTHRKELNKGKDYDKVVWGKKAKEVGVKPEHLHQLAAEIAAHDAEHVERRKRLLKDTRNQLTKMGYDARALTTNLGSGHVEDNIPHMDIVSRSMANLYPDQFAGDKDALDNQQRLIDMLTEGNPKPIDSYSAYQHALDHLLELKENQGDTGNEVSDRPLWDAEEQESDPWNLQPFQSPASPPPPQTESAHHPAKLTAAWQRYHERDQNAKGGGLFGGEDLQARRGFSRLPDETPFLFVTGEFEGQTGKIVHDNGRIVGEVDGRFGYVPIDPSSIEPLSPALSWRTEASAAPSKQASLLTADHFLPKRKDADEDSVPFARNTGRDNMRSTWDQLTPSERGRRLERVSIHFSRMANEDGLDPAAFGKADDLDTLLAGAAPDFVEDRLSAAREAIERGAMTFDDAVTMLCQSLPGNPTATPDPNASQRLERIIRDALSSDKTLAEAALADADQSEPTPPRQQAPLAFARQAALQNWRHRFNR